MSNEISCPFVADLVDRRCKFTPRTSTPPEGWTLLKWRDAMNLTPFVFKNELELEFWAEENAPRIALAEPTYATFLSVLQLEADKCFQPILRKLELYHHYLEDFIDAFTLEYFTDSRLATRLEAAFFEHKEAASVTEAYSSLMLAVRTYSYVARRRKRPNFLTEPFLCDTLIRNVPKDVRKLITDANIDASDLLETLTDCLQAEAKLDCAPEAADTPTQAAQRPLTAAPKAGPKAGQPSPARQY